MNKLEETARNKLTRQSRDLYYWLKWRVTFMWKDPEYLKSWEEIKNIREKAGYLIDFIELWLDRNYRNTKAFATECRITEKFDYMGMFINPQKSFDEMIGGNNNIKLSLRSYLAGVFRSGAAITNPDKAEYDPKGLLIKIDFSKINQITELKKLIDDKITLEYQYYLKQNERDSLNKTDFDNIYQVGFLKEANFSWGKIANIVYRDDPLSSAKSKVKQHHARYLEMINGGWRKIKFP
jgi:hypothetical protein